MSSYRDLFKIQLAVQMQGIGHLQCRLYLQQPVLTSLSGSYTHSAISCEIGPSLDPAFPPCSSLAWLCLILFPSNKTTH